MGRFPRVSAEISDGTSNTYMIGEDVPELNVHNGWAYCNGANGTCAIPPNTGVTIPSSGGLGPADRGNWPERYSLRSRHPSGVMASYCDGSVRFIPNNIALATWQTLSTMNDGVTEIHRPRTTVTLNERWNPSNR